MPIEVEILPRFQSATVECSDNPAFESSDFQPMHRVSATEPEQPDKFEPDESVDHVDINLEEVKPSLT